MGRKSWGVVSIIHFHNNRQKDHTRMRRYKGGKSLRVLVDDPMSRDLAPFVGCRAIKSTASGGIFDLPPLCPRLTLANLIPVDLVSYSTVDTDIVLLFCCFWGHANTDLMKPLVAATITLDPVNLRKRKKLLPQLHIKTTFFIYICVLLEKDEFSEDKAISFNGVLPWRYLHKCMYSRSLKMAPFWWGIAHFKFGWDQMDEPSFLPQERQAQFKLNMDKSFISIL